MDAQELLQQPVDAIAAAVRAGTISAEALTVAALAAIDGDAALGAFISVAHEAALTAARAIDARRVAGETLGPLAGVPVGIKDALCTLDQPTSCASRILVSADGQRGAGKPDASRGFRAPYDATVVERLRAADAVLVGKTNLDEFAMGSSTENSAFGPSLNPWDRARTPGGSSGGSAAAVAGGLVPLALGSDTGGSIRQPASFCGVVGVKPSYGRVSRRGLIAFASSLDQVGPFAHDVRSAARMLQVIAGVDPGDATSAALPVPDYVAACDRGIAGLRVGVPEEYFGAGLDPAVRASVEQLIAALRDAGATIRPVSLPHTRHGIATYYVLATAEASSNLARFDGVRYGLRVERAGADLAALYGDTRDAGFGAEVKRRILLGTYVLSAGYYEAYYRKAQRVRTLIRQDFDRVFADVDVLVTPASPTVAFEFGARTEDPLAMYLADIYTLPASLAGIAGLSVPTAPLEVNGKSLPVGAQLLAAPFAEETLFAVAAWWEARSPAKGLRAPTAAP